MSVQPSRVEAGSTQTLTFFAPTEHDAALVALSILLPQGTVVLDTPDGRWRSTVDGRHVRWAGEVVPPDGAEFFRLVIQAPEEEGERELTAIQRFDDGHASRWSMQLNVAQTPGQNLVAAVVVAAVGVSLLVGLVVLRQRQRTAPSGETYD